MPLLYGSMAGYSVRCPVGNGFRFRALVTTRRTDLREATAIGLRERRVALRLVAIGEPQNKTFEMYDRNYGHKKAQMTQN
jgi:hypothetical protein